MKEKTTGTAKFGDFLLSDGTVTANLPADLTDIRGIYLYDGIFLVDASEKKKMYRKADNWCGEHGGVIPSVKTLYFISFYFEEINKLREKIGKQPLAKNLLAWSSDGSETSNALTAFNYAVEIYSGVIKLLISSSALIDDCSLANAVCVIGEQQKKRRVF